MGWICDLRSDASGRRRRADSGRWSRWRATDKIQRYCGNGGMQARQDAASAEARKVIGKFDQLRVIERLQYLEHDRLPGPPRPALVVA